jgi:hypothetical protein
LSLSQATRRARSVLPQRLVVRTFPANACACWLPASPARRPVERVRSPQPLRPLPRSSRLGRAVRGVVCAGPGRSCPSLPKTRPRIHSTLRLHQRLPIVDTILAPRSFTGIHHTVSTRPLTSCCHRFAAAASQFRKSFRATFISCPTLKLRKPRGSPTPSTSLPSAEEHHRTSPRQTASAKPGRSPSEFTCGEGSRPPLRTPPRQHRTGQLIVALPPGTSSDRQRPDI